MDDATTAPKAGMGWPARIITGFLFIAFIATGGMKLAGAETPKHEFERFGYPAWFMTLTVGFPSRIASGQLLGSPCSSGSSFARTASVTTL